MKLLCDECGIEEEIKLRDGLVLFECGNVRVKTPEDVEELVSGDGWWAVMTGAEVPMDGNPCDDIIKELDAIEQAIVDICPIDMVQAIHERKRMIRKR